MPNKQLVKHKTAASLDKKSGSLAYNRFEMQISQTLHMAIELYSNLNYLLVLDHYVKNQDTIMAISELLKKQVYQKEVQHHAKRRDAGLLT